MLTVYRPDQNVRGCVDPSYKDYMPSGSAAILDEYLSAQVPNGSLEQVQLRNCKVPDYEHYWWEKNPLLFFSPGLGYTRGMYSAILIAIASSGYTILSMDHTYSAAAVEFPDGEIAIGNRETPSNTTGPGQPSPEDTVAVQVKDVESILAAIKTGKISVLPAYNKNVKIPMFGHSAGGATALVAMENITEIIGGLNYDGSFVPPSLTVGTDRPFLAMGETFRMLSEEAHDDPTWDEVWPNLRGWKSELVVNNTRHTSFSDTPLWEVVLGINDTIYLGNTEPSRMHKIIWEYTVAYMDFLTKGGSPKLLTSNSTAYPEVVHTR